MSIMQHILIQEETGDLFGEATIFEEPEGWKDDHQDSAL